MPAPHPCVFATFCLVSFFFFLATLQCSRVTWRVSSLDWAWLTSSRRWGSNSSRPPADSGVMAGCLWWLTAWRPAQCPAVSWSVSWSVSSLVSCSVSSSILISFLISILSVSCSVSCSILIRILISILSVSCSASCREPHSVLQCPAQCPEVFCPASSSV